MRACVRPEHVYRVHRPIMSTSVSPLHVQGLRARLNQLRMPELRNILMDLNLARSGRKQELVERIARELEVRRHCCCFLVTWCEALILLCTCLCGARGSLPTKLEARRLLRFTRIGCRPACGALRCR